MQPDALTYTQGNYCFQANEHISYYSRFNLGAEIAFGQRPAFSTELHSLRSSLLSQ